MSFDLKSWSEANGFAYSPFGYQHTGKMDSDVICREGLITTSDDVNGWLQSFPQMSL